MQEKLTCKCMRGDTKHQRGVRRILARCGKLISHEVFATQAVFVKSHSAAHFSVDSKMKMSDVGVRRKTWTGLCRKSEARPVLDGTK